MLEFSLPFSMVVGGALISSPILIHLINRMRFKRIRWAAMEFLLKSQKRNRRRLLIEQLVLLLLRILLVLLAGFLLARFVGFALAGNAPQNTRNVVLIDDTLSMNDRWVDDKGESRSALADARRCVVEDVAKNALKSNTTQFLTLRRTTRPDEELFDEKLSDQTVRDLAEKALPRVTGTALHVELIESIARARSVFDDHPLDKRVLYVVSDFRRADWSGPALDAAAKQLNELLKQKIEVKLIDVADPVRQTEEKEARRHANLALTRFRPTARLVGKDIGTEFVGQLVNYSDAVRRNVQVRVKVDGQDRPEMSLPLPELPPGEERSFTLPQPIYFGQTGFHAVTASVDFDVKQEGLEEDNARHALIEVRDRVPVLAIDGDLTNSRKENGDAFFLQAMFDRNGASAGYDLKVVGPSDAEALNLTTYANIYVLNVGTLSDKLIASLDRYVRGGGSAAFFVGERVLDTKFYNEKLYRNGEGIFPVPLDRASPELSEEESRRRREESLNDPQMQMFLRDPAHPVLAGVGNPEMRFLFYFINLDRYYIVPRALWKPQPGRSEELITLPNRKSVKDYKEGVQALLDQLPRDDPKVGERFRYHRSLIQAVLASDQPLHRLATALDELLRDKGDPSKPAERPNLVEFLSAPDHQALKADIERWLETTRYGDPLLVAAKVGRGQSVVCLTTLGKRWNNWAGGADGSDTYPLLMRDLQRYLTGVPQDADRTVGQKLALAVDPAIYKDKARAYVIEDKGGQPTPLPNDLVATAGPGQLAFSFDQAERPGAYLIELSAKADDAKEMRGFTFNVDAASESDLRRASPDDIRAEVKGVEWYSAGSVDLVPRDEKRDLSQGPWLFLFFLVLLVAEQAMAVHLSFHAHEAQAPAGAASRPVVA